MQKRRIFLMVVVGLIFLGSVHGSLLAVIKKGPYLMLNPNQPTEMSVLWQTDTTETCTIAWGTTTAYGNSVTTTEYGTDHQHQYVLSGLTSNTLYYYRLTIGSHHYPGSFRTAPDSSATQVKFFVYGDTRTNPADHNKVAAQINHTYTQEPHYQTMTLFTGDYAHGNTETYWSSDFFPRTQENILYLQAHLPIMPCRGNHEKNGTMLVKYFPYGYQDGFYYSFDYGPVHVAVLDQDPTTNRQISTTQLTWLENDLAHSTKTWKILVFHAPGWSAGGEHENNLQIQTDIQPLCVKYGVRLVFSGHNHYYARALVGGVHHVTSGGGGAPLVQPESGFPNVVLTRYSFDLCKISIQGNILNLEAVDEQGNVLDSLRLTAPATPPHISLGRDQLYFSATTAGVCTGAQTLLMDNNGGETLNWVSTSHASWLKVTPGTGTDSGLLTVSVDPAHLAVDQYTGLITVSAVGAVNTPQTITVHLKVLAQGDTAPPFGVFATPVHNTTCSGSIPVTGWVLDDIEVVNVKLYTGAHYIGDALLVEGARPDVATAFPAYPKNQQAGWGYMLLTHFLPGGGNGEYTLYAIATDAEGNEVTLGSTTITIDNKHAVKPFGALDTPTQGGNASGSHFLNFAWALTPLPNQIPIDGTGLAVWVDGVKLGAPTYNLYREDIATLFPGYANSNHAVGYFTIDTTMYKNGIHTIQWTATDNAGNTDGIGSRYFAIQNITTPAEKNSPTNAQANRLNAKKNQALPHSIALFRGFLSNGLPAFIQPDKNGIFTIEIHPLERIEIHFPPTPPANMTPISPLPIGSTWDPHHHILYWQPGVGFLGTFPFAFLSQTTPRQKTILNVKIVPDSPL